jgi:hypothetical protein
MDKKLKKATRKLVDSMASIPEKPKECSGDCSCKTKKPNMALRGYGFGEGESDGSWFFLLTGFNSKESVEAFKAGLVAWIKSHNDEKELQGKEIDELLRKTPASTMPSV